MFRVLLRSLLALVVVAAAGLVAWRVLAPAEVLEPATTPYPMLVGSYPGVTGRANVAPLIVDDRLRVYAGKRQLRADTPVGSKGVNTARWSFRRWPEQLSGVVAVGRTVVSRWSDGELVALDARSGEIAWRVTGPGGPGFTGHRTGARTVWSPAGLHTGEGAVLVAEGTDLIAYEAASGTERWRATVPDGCADGFTTAGGQYVCGTGAYSLDDGRPVTSWPTGPYTPVSCDVAASSCAGLRDSAGQGWLTGAATARRETRLDAPETTVVAGTVYTPPPGTRMLGVAGNRAVLLTAERSLRVTDPRTGVTSAEFPLRFGTEKLTFDPGLWQVSAGWVAIERLADDGPTDPEVQGYYFTTETVIIAAL